MAVVPFAAMAAGGIWALAGAVVRMAASRAVQVGVAGTVIHDVLNIDWFNQETLKLAAPGSDPASVNDAAKMAIRMLGIEDGSVLWPRDRRTGQLLFPKYFHVDLVSGRAWLTPNYYSRKSLNASFKRGASFGRRRGFRNFRRPFTQQVRNG